MLATVTLTGAWEVLFYLACVYIVIDFAIDLFVILPRYLNKVLDRVIEKRDKKAMEEKSKIDGLFAHEIERRIEVYKTEKNNEGASENDRRSLGARIAALEEVLEFYRNNNHL